MRVYFGCGAKKLALMGGFPEQEAKDKLKSFLDNIGLTGVLWNSWKYVRTKYKRGKGFYIPSAFGYWIYCDSVHKSVNYLNTIRGSSSTKESDTFI